jgi:hypothetical protein
MIKIGATKSLGFVFEFTFNYLKFKEPHVASGYNLDSNALEISCAYRNILFYTIGILHISFCILFFPLNSAIYAIRSL